MARWTRASTALICVAWLGTCGFADDVREPWTMHHISNEYLIANSLSPADLNGDGCMDYAVIDESLGSQTVLFHPGPGGDVRRPWRRVLIGVTGNPEYSCLGDVDGDGCLDLVVVEGDDLEKGLSTGVRIVYGPQPSRTADPSAWADAGHVPGTEGQQYLYCETHDLNADGTADILVGGRRHPTTKQYAGLRWLLSSQDPAQRRELAAWKTCFIDPGALSGHGFVVVDVDRDDDLDIVDANADWDTSLFDQELYWYENPGPGTPEQLRTWKKHSIWKTTQFYAKPQVGVDDMNGDGLLDLVTQTQNFVQLFVGTSGTPPAWDRVPIVKPETVQWIGRGIRFVDLNEDGRMDIVGMLIHNDGHLPKSKASVFWMEYEGEKPDRDWAFHPIKWADGYNSRDQWIGEKWDHCRFDDVDGDGDLDIVANVEEHFRRVAEKDESFYSVVWFENPLK